MTDPPSEGLEKGVPVLQIHYRETTDSLGILLNLDAMREPNEWGLLLANVIQLMGNTFCQQEGTFDPAPYIETIREALLEELEQPAPPDIGRRID
jgi:hypothetical protein